MKHNPFSIVIPIFNEEDNIEILIDEIFLNLNDYSEFEIILVNDGSIDNSSATISSLKYQNLKLIDRNVNKGQSYSILEGVKNSKYQTIITLDGDGQNNPKDIPILLNKYFSDKQLSLVGGIRVKRKDSFIKILSSRIANRVRSFILKDNCSDTGCSLKVFDKKIFLTFPFFTGMHRFLPALFSGFGYKTFFLEVDHRTRKKGFSKYGTFDRLYKGIIDIRKVINILKENKDIK